MVKGADGNFDGLPDEFELLYWGNATSGVTGVIDFDGDGLTNIEEFVGGTDPTVKDTGRGRGVAWI